jgi:hypothetical protein
MSAPNNQFYDDLKNEVISIAHSQDVNKYLEIEDVLKDFFVKDYISILEFADLCEIFIQELGKVSHSRKNEETREDILESIKQIQIQRENLKKSELEEIEFSEHVLDARNNIKKNK